LVTNSRWIGICVKVVDAYFKIRFGLRQGQAKTVSVPNNKALSLKRYIPNTRITNCYHNVKILGEDMVEIFVVYS